MEKKYFITADLERTVPESCRKLQNQLPDQKINIDTKLRKELAKVLDQAFEEKVTQIINYDSIYSFFKEQQKEDEFIVSLESGIHIDDADFYYSAARVYNNQKSVTNDPSDYEVRQRDGKYLGEQNQDLKQKIQESDKKEIVICDDGMFSGSTIENVINSLENNGFKVKEIRVVLNFTGSFCLNGIPVNSMSDETSCIDWLDERDLFYGTLNGGAAFWNDGKIDGLPYIFSGDVVNKKASIPENVSEDFCRNMMDINSGVWDIAQKYADEIIKLVELPRIQFLASQYQSNLGIQDILEREKSKFNSSSI